MPAALAQPRFVDLTSPGTGPFVIHVAVSAALNAVVKS